MSFNIILGKARVQTGKMENSTSKKSRRHTSSATNMLSDPQELALVPFDSNKERMIQHSTGSFILKKKMLALYNEDTRVILDRNSKVNTTFSQTIVFIVHQ